MRGCLKAFAAFGMVVALAAPAMAQGQGRGGMGGMMGGGVNLIANPGVQKELKLDEAQVKKAGEVTADAQAKMQDMRSATEGLEGAARMKKMQELMKTSTDESMLTLGTFLKPEQMKRFKEIQFQQRGAQVLADPAIAAALKVTGEQAGKVKSILADSQEEMREIQQGAADDRQGAQRKMQVLRKETTTKVMALMTDDQKKMWKEMSGEPYELVQQPRRPQ